MNKEKKATNPEDLEKQIMDCNIPKNEREWWAKRRIEELEKLVNTSKEGDRTHEQGEPEWIVNDLGELGVEIEGRCFFLYKGSSLEYGSNPHDDGTAMLYRRVGKREFGETQWPQAWLGDGKGQERYVKELIYNPLLSDGKPEDGAWKPLPVEIAEGENTPAPSPVRVPFSEAAVVCGDCGFTAKIEMFAVLKGRDIKGQRVCPGCGRHNSII